MEKRSNAFFEARRHTARSLFHWVKRDETALQAFDALQQVYQQTLAFTKPVTTTASDVTPGASPTSQRSKAAKAPRAKRDSSAPFADDAHPLSAASARGCGRDGVASMTEATSMTDCIFELVLLDSVTGQEVKEYILARDDEDAYDGLAHWLDRERYEILRCSPLPGLLCESVR